MADKCSCRPTYWNSKLFPALQSLCWWERSQKATYTLNWIGQLYLSGPDFPESRGSLFIGEIQVSRKKHYETRSWAHITIRCKKWRIRNYQANKRLQRKNHCGAMSCPYMVNKARFSWSVLLIGQTIQPDIEQRNTQTLERTWIRLVMANACCYWCPRRDMSA